jgi:hypothetical protein
MPYIRLLAKHFVGGNEEYNEEPQAGKLSLWAENQTQDLPNTKQKH